MFTYMCMCQYMSVREKEREREGDRERECVRVCVCVSVCVCVCVCVCMCSCAYTCLLQMCAFRSICHNLCVKRFQKLCSVKQPHQNLFSNVSSESIIIITIVRK